MSIDTRQCTKKSSQPIDSNVENELVCVCDSQTQVEEKAHDDHSDPERELSLQRHFSASTKFAHVKSRFCGRKQ